MNYKILKLGADEYICANLIIDEYIYYEVCLGLAGASKNYISIYVYTYKKLEKIFWGDFFQNKILWGDEGALGLGNNKDTVENLICKLHKLTCFI